jgi:hypothetical protein
MSCDALIGDEYEQPGSREIENGYKPTSSIIR